MSFRVTDGEIDRSGRPGTLRENLHQVMDMLIEMTVITGGGAVHVQSEVENDTRTFRATLADVTNAELCEVCSGTGIKGSVHG